MYLKLPDGMNVEIQDCYIKNLMMIKDVIDFIDLTFKDSFSIKYDEKKWK